jgi:RNA polymerase sigma factor (sigma-70 family)
MTRPPRRREAARSRRYTRVVTAAPRHGQFATTRWSLVITAAAEDRSPIVQEALATLCETYWYPLYVFLRGRGYNAEDAQDLTQAFFARVLEKHTLRHADPARGRFRSFLLVSLRNFVANEHDRQGARKRGGRTPLLSLDLNIAEQRFQLEPGSDDTPERVFDRLWALTLLERVMSRLQAETAHRPAKGPVFEALKPYLTGDEPQLSYAQTAFHLGMSEGAVKIAVHRLRRRFRELVRDEIAHTVSSPEEVDVELRHLWSAVAR